MRERAPAIHVRLDPRPKFSRGADPRVIAQLLELVLHGRPRHRLHEGCVPAIARPAVKDKLEELGNDTRVSTPSEFRARVEQDMARWRPLAHVVNQS